MGCGFVGGGSTGSTGPASRIFGLIRLFWRGTGSFKESLAMTVWLVPFDDSRQQVFKYNENNSSPGRLFPSDSQDARAVVFVMIGVFSMATLQVTQGACRARCLL